MANYASVAGQRPRTGGRPRPRLCQAPPPRSFAADPGAFARRTRGGAVGGGWYGAAPKPDRLDATGNPGFAIDFRSVYATALERWWGLPSQAILKVGFPLVGGLLG